MLSWVECAEFGLGGLELCYVTLGWGGLNKI